MLGADETTPYSQFNFDMRNHIFFLALASGLSVYQAPAPGADDVAGVRGQAESWRAEHRTIDLHHHINYTTQHLTRAVKIMDAAGLGIAVNLSGGTVTIGTNGGPSEFERNKRLVDSLFPGRYLHYFNLDYKGWDKPD